MSKPIVLKTRHKLGAEVVKQRISERFETLKRTVKLDRVGDARISWEGDTATISAKALGQRAKALIVVGEHDMTITIDLPALLAPFRGAIVAFIEKQEGAVKGTPEDGQGIESDRRPVAFDEGIDGQRRQRTNLGLDLFVRPVPPGNAQKALDLRLGAPRADDPSRIAADDRVRRDVLCHDSVGGNDGAGAYLHSRNDRRMRADPHIGADLDAAAVLVILKILCGAWPIIGQRPERIGADAICSMIS